MKISNSSAACALLCSLYNPLHAEEISIEVNGFVSGATCNVSLNGEINPIVTLPKVPISLLSTHGQTAGEKNIILEMTGCSLSANKKVIPYFIPGINLTSSGGRLKNTATKGAAANVELQLLHQGQAINLANNAGDQNAGFAVIPDIGGSATIEYTIRYYATGQAKPGKVHSAMAWEVQYN